MRISKVSLYSALLIFALFGPSEELRAVDPAPASSAPVQADCDPATDRKCAEIGSEYKAPPPPQAADGTVTQAGADKKGDKTADAKKPEQKKPQDNGQSFLRQYLPDNSFDQASESTAKVTGYKFKFKDCQQPNANPKLKEFCANASNMNQNSSETTQHIAKEQSVMADISRVSDVAAVAAVGGALGGEVFKDSSQASSLNSMAKIQKTASKAGYVSGATDLGLGAYAYLKQKKQLEEIQRQTNGVIANEDGSSISNSTTNRSYNNDMNRAIADTKKAAYNHMLSGAGKVVVGFVSAKLAERTERQKKALESLKSPSTAGTASPLLVPSTGSSAPVQNNQPGFYTSSGSSGMPGTSSGNTPGASGGIGASSGTSVGPTGKNALLAANAARSPASGGALGSSAGTGKNALADAMNDAKKKADGEEAAKKDDLLSKFEYSPGRGGGSRYTGGGDGGGGGGSDLGSVIASALGLGNNSANNPTGAGVDPSAFTGASAMPEDQGMAASNAGVSTDNKDLFSLVKAKHLEMLQQGRLLGAKEKLN